MSQFNNQHACNYRELHFTSFQDKLLF